MGKLDGKVAVITGGNSGIGFATAQLFIQEGATVVITGRDVQRVGEAVKQLGPKSAGIISDVSSKKDLQELQSKVLSVTSVIDILFVNAGIVMPTPMEHSTEEMYDTVHDTNLKGTYFTIQKLLPLMRAGGSIILNSTIGVHTAMPGLGIVIATKAGVLALGKTLAVELASRRIRVNSVTPGVIVTPGITKSGLSEENIQQMFESIVARIPLNRLGEAKEIASAALFLASEDSSYVTGTEIIVDGGKTALF